MFGPIAQWLEQPAHNRLVPGSIPGGPTTIMYIVYVIEDENHLRYIGQTEDIIKRLEVHNSGLSFYTSR